LTDRIRFAVRLTPKTGRDAVAGWDRGPDGQVFLKARVSAAPENGKANDALVRLIAKKLRIGSSRVQIVSGATARTKIIEVQALDVLPAGFGDES
jgi:uncharacterized protein YggU (UPF0235/DUF167 family)